eukprot:1071019-Pyramimonas_sp.AAC.1
MLWSCTAHLVFDSTVSVKTAAAKNVASGFRIPHFLGDYIHGVSASVKGGCRGPDLRESRHGQGLRPDFLF